MQNLGKKLNIMDPKVWEITRFADIAKEIIDKLQDNEAKKFFIGAFQNGYNEQLTYFEFHNLLLKEMRVESCADWQYEDF